MANTEEVKTSAGKKPTPTAGQATANGASRFTKVVTDRPMYRAEKCSAKPLVGYLIGLTAMPPRQLMEEERAQGKSGAWNAYVVLTTEPTLAVKTKGEAPVEIPVGVEVIIAESAKLEELRKYLSADKMIEVSVSTTGTVDLAGGKRLRTFDIGANFDHPVPRPAKYALPSAGLPPAKQLAAAEEADDGMPF